MGSCYKESPSILRVHCCKGNLVFLAFRHPDTAFAWGPEDNFPWWLSAGEIRVSGNDCPDIPKLAPQEAQSAQIGPNLSQFVTTVKAAVGDIEAAIHVTAPRPWPNLTWQNFRSPKTRVWTDHMLSTTMSIVEWTTIPAPALCHPTLENHCIQWL